MLTFLCVASQLVQYKFGLLQQNDSFFLMTDTSCLVNSENFFYTEIIRFDFIISFTLVRVVFFPSVLFAVHVFENCDFRRYHLIDSYLCLVIFGFA